MTQDNSQTGEAMTFGRPFEMTDIIQSIAIEGHNAWLGLRHHGDSDEWVELALPWKPELVADEVSGMRASGPIISLMDNAMGIAVWKRRGFFIPHVTTDLRVDYLRDAGPGLTLIGRGECFKLTRSFAFVRGIAYDESPDDPVASVVGSFMLVGESK